jgi:ADP-ribose pyrophosphatase
LPKHTLLSTSRFDVEQVHFRTSDGASHERAVIRHPGAVAVIPLLDDDRVCLIRNDRIGVGRELVELPAGTLEPDEPPEETAERELWEETGFRAGRITPLKSFFLSPGILDERMHLFVAEQLTETTPHREAGERIENYVVRWDVAMRMIEQGEIEDAKTLVGLLLYDRLRKGCDPAGAQISGFF